MGLGDKVGENPTELESRIGTPGFRKVKLDPTERLIYILERWSRDKCFLPEVSQFLYLQGSKNKKYISGFKK